MMSVPVPDLLPDGVLARELDMRLLLGGAIETLRCLPPHVAPADRSKALLSDLANQLEMAAGRSEHRTLGQSAAAVGIVTATQVVVGSAPRGALTKYADALRKVSEGLGSDEYLDDLADALSAIRNRLAVDRAPASDEVVGLRD